MDWVELIIFAVVVLFGLLAGDRKKSRRQPPARPRPRPSPRETGAATGPRSAQDPRTIAEQLLERMRRQAEAEARAEREATLEPMHTSEAVSLETDVPERYEREPPSREIVVREIGEERDLTLETLEGAGEASHRRFHDRYMTPLAEVPPAPVPRMRMTPRQAREAFVLMAVFGRPKGLE
jgi:hypothetical protein